MSAVDALRVVRSVVGWLRFGSFARRNPVVVAVAVVIGAFAVAGPAYGAVGVLGAVCVGVSFGLFSLQRRIVRYGLRLRYAGGSHSGGSRGGE